MRAVPAEGRATGSAPGVVLLVLEPWCPAGSSWATWWRSPSLWPGDNVLCVPGPRGPQGGGVRLGSYRSRPRLAGSSREAPEGQVVL